jgi:hypothetical protein
LLQSVAAVVAVHGRRHLLHLEVHLAGEVV